MQGTSAIGAIAAYVYRDLLRWSRARLNVISTLAMPAAWLIFVGLALPTTFTDNYLDFITPSILVLTMLSAGLAGGSSLMFDKILGYLNKFLAMPAPRESILMGKILFISIRGLIQATIILAIALLIGATILPLFAYLEMYGILFLFGVLVSGFGTTIALYLGDHDSYAAAQAFISMPLFFTSSALMPYSAMPPWLEFCARLNPVSYAIDAARAAAVGEIPFLPIIVLVFGAAVMLCICSVLFRGITVR